MPIFIGTDHRGFELKNKLLEYLQEKNIRVEDLGNYQYDPLDDYPDFVQKVVQAVLQNPKEHMGIVICGSGIGACAGANRFNNIICALGFDEHQIQHGRENDHINMLALPAEYIDFEKAKNLVDAFLNNSPKNEPKYLRRLNKLNTITEF